MRWPSRAVRWLAAWAWDRAALTLAAVAVAVLAAGLALPSLPIDPSLEGLLGHDAPANQATRALHSTFGTDESVVVVVGAPDVYAANVLGRLAALQADLRAEVPHLTAVQSLIDAPVPRVVDDRVFLGPSLAPWPAPHEVSARIDALRRSGAYTGLLVDAGARTTIVLLTLAPPAAGASRVASRSQCRVDTSRGRRRNDCAAGRPASVAGSANTMDGSIDSGASGAGDASTAARIASAASSRAIDTVVMAQRACRLRITTWSR